MQIEIYFFNNEKICNQQNLNFFTAALGTYKTIFVNLTEIFKRKKGPYIDSIKRNNCS